MSAVIKHRVWVVVPAAGIGRRMSSQLPKQYLPLAGTTVIEHTLGRLLSVGAVRAIVLALHQDDDWFASLAVSRDPKIHSVAGGDQRSHSVLAALNSLDNKSHPDDWVLVHDAARPCVRPDIISAMIQQLWQHPVGGILGIPATDTLKQVNPQGTIDFTVDRQHIWQAQTPQMFRYGLLRDSLRQALAAGQVITDEASALECAAHQPQMVMGHQDNIKITHPDDLAVAETILQMQRRQNQPS